MQKRGCIKKGKVHARENSLSPNQLIFREREKGGFNGERERERKERKKKREHNKYREK